MKLIALKQKVARLERDLLLDELARHDFNQTRAADAMDCPTSTLRRYIDRHPGVVDTIKKRGPGPGRPSPDQV